MEIRATCRVNRRGGVTLIYGHPSREDLASIARRGSPQDVLSPELAKAVGATFACGPRAAVDALLNDVRDENLGRAETGLTS